MGYPPIVAGFCLVRRQGRLGVPPRRPYERVYVDWRVSIFGMGVSRRRVWLQGSGFGRGKGERMRVHLRERLGSGRARLRRKSVPGRGRLVV